MINPNDAQQRAAFSSLRHAIDATGYGRWVSDDVLRGVATQVCVSVLNVPAPPVVPVIPVPATLKTVKKP